MGASLWTKCPWVAEKNRDDTEVSGDHEKHFGVQILTSGDWTNQHSVELDDRAEDVLGVRGTGWVLAMEFEDQTLVLFLQQNQDVLQEDGVELWEEDNSIV